MLVFHLNSIQCVDIPRQSCLKDADTFKGVKVFQIIL